MNFIKDLEDLLILVLDLDEAQLLFFVFADEADQFSALLNLVERLDKLVREVLDPFDVLVFDLDKRLSDALFPFSNDRNISLVLDNRLRRVRLDLLKLLKLVFVLFVDVVQVL